MNRGPTGPRQSLGTGGVDECVRGCHVIGNRDPIVTGITARCTDMSDTTLVPF